MRLTLFALALGMSMPVLGTTQASAYWWGEGTYYDRGYRSYEPRSYTYRERRYYRGMRHYRARPEAYRTGSRRWWREMDREDRGGRGSTR